MTPPPPPPAQPLPWLHATGSQFSFFGITIRQKQTANIALITHSRPVSCMPVDNERLYCDHSKCLGLRLGTIRLLC